jgi:formylglycine-generating enzyme required for sulfatase activity
MKNYLFIVFLFVSCLSFGQTRNLKLAPTANPTTERRKAVVIGMSEYGAGRSLNNTLNDADDMANVLQQLGFKVTLLANIEMRDLETNLTAWYKTIDGIDMAVFYFSGHGVEVDGSNYLIPIKAELHTEADVRYRTLSVNWVLDNMALKQVRFKLLILDACRDNPFTKGWSRSSSERGLADIPATKGTLVAFAAAPGKLAHDGGTYDLPNGVFTYFLKQELLSEGASIDNILNRVAGKVSNLTNDQQLPYKTGILTDDYYFKPRASMSDRPDRPVEVAKKYYYYVDQNGKEADSRFDDRKKAENEMRSKNLYGKIYSNSGEVFVVEKPVEPPKPAEPSKPVTATKSNGDTWNPDGIEMVYVKGGSFTMGCTSEQGSDCFDNEKPAHQVTVSDFYIGRYEVTQGQWKAIMGSNPSHFSKGDNYPVEQVSWEQVQEFISKLNAKTGANYRLPTEAEWEYAARGGNRRQRYKYSGSNNLADIAWYTENSGSNTHPVGSKSPNELGIYDMSGNVREWCNDWKGTYTSSSQQNPKGASSGSDRVIRGGSWGSNAKYARVSYRGIWQPDDRNGVIGFRLARSSK